jgi:5-methylcytosine-specific restriction protein A
MGNVKPCRQPGCPEIVESGYCSDHSKARNVQLRKDRAGTAIYNSARWKRLRKQKLALNPLCEECGVKLATEVDHVEGIHDRPDLAYVLSNLRSLDSSCHGKKTNREVRERVY